MLVDGELSLKVRISKRAIDFDGKPEEISQFIINVGLDKLYEGTLTPDQLKVVDVINKSEKEYSPKVAELKKKMPNVGQIISYIKSKQDYKHTIPELAEKLLGEKIKSYGDTQYIYIQLCFQI